MKQPNPLRSRRRICWSLAATLGMSTALAACSGDDEPSSKQDHVLKEKTQTIDKARDVDRLLEEAATRQRDATQ